MSIYLARGKKRSSKSARARDDRLFTPPSRGSRAVMMSGGRSLSILGRSLSIELARQSRRSSKRSGGLHIARASRRSVAEAITPTIRGRVFTVLYIERDFLGWATAHFLGASEETIRSTYLAGLS